LQARSQLIGTWRKDETMARASDGYLLPDSVPEVERLQMQARVWQPETEAMLDQIGLQAGWRCVDLGCGAMGILGPLSRRVGPTGRVVGVDLGATYLDAARGYVQDEDLANVEILERDAYDTGLPRESFDFVHVRFVFGPAGRDDEFLREMLALARPGGLVAIQEAVDDTPWRCYPPHPTWERLTGAILAAFARGAGDFNVGQRTYGMLRGAGLRDVQIRPALLVLQHGHPYLRLPILMAASLRERIVGEGLLSEAELEEALVGCEQALQDPERFALTFVVSQVWGRKPGG
jgi:SAM-dependent methyltransferase